MPLSEGGFLSSAGSLICALLLPFTGVLLKRLWTDPQATELLWNGEGAQRHSQLYSSPLQWKPHQKMRSIWLLIYPLMGYASWRILWSPQPHAAALGLYGALLVATWLCWPPIIAPKRWQSGLLDTSVLGAVMAATVAWFSSIDKLAALLLLPHLGWTVFATVLVNSLNTDHQQALAEGQRLAALKKEPSGKHEADVPLQNGPPSASGPARPPREQSLPLGSTTYRADLSPPAPIPTESPREQPSLTTSRSLKVRTGSQQAASPRQEPARRTSSGEGGYIPSGWLSPLSPFKSSIDTAAGLLRESVHVGGTPSKQGSGSLSRQSSGAMRSSVSAVAGLLSRASTALSATMEATGSALMRGMSGRRSVSADDELPAVREPRSDTIDLKYFGQPGSAGFKVRGENYLADKKKYTPDEPVMKMGSANLLTQSRPTFHIARFLPSIRDSPAPFTFLWQVMVPGKQNYSLTLAWQLDYDPVSAVNQALMRIPEEQGGVADEDAQWEQPDIASDPAWQQQMREQQDASSLPASAAPSTTGHTTPGASSADEAEEGLDPPPARGHGHKRSRSRLEEVASDERTLFGNPREAPTKAAPKPKAGERTMYSHCRPFDVAVMRMLDESGTAEAKEKRRHSAFKVIPRVQEGNWVVKQAVGSTPALLGHKLVTKYFRGPRYLEVDLDVGSSRSAAHVVGLVSGALKGLVIDLAVVLEGRTQDELPESLLGTVRLLNLDLTQAAHLDNDTGEISDKKF